MTDYKDEYGAVKTKAKTAILANPWVAVLVGIAVGFAAHALLF